MWISSGEGTTPSTFLLASGRSSTAINDRNCSGARGVEGTPAGPVYGNLRAAPSASQAAIVGGMGEGGGLRILFFADRPGGADRYMSLVSELSERGHEVHLAFQLSRGALPRKPAPPGVTYGFAPERRAFDGWLSVAWLVRAIGDLARYAHPRYEDAPVLRARMRKKVLKRLKKPGEFEPIGRRVALRLARRLASTTDAKLSERVIRASGDERLQRLGIVIRPHPVAKGWRHADLGRFENLVIWPTRSVRPVTPGEHADFFDSLAHSVAVVGINTTAMIEAAIVGKSVLTVLAPEFAQESTLHFHYLLDDNGGFLHVASSLAEHAGQLARVLDEDAAGAEQRRRFVESFVRPHGLGRPATPILADAVEELAGVPVQRHVRPGSLLLRGPLAIEAGMCRLLLATPR